MTPAARISSDTWHRLARARLVGARLGEETLTDLLVLEMLHFQRSNAFRVYHPTRRDESWCGADLLVWIRRNDGLSRFLAIQAKKLYPDGNCKSLNHHAPGGTRQIDLLHDFAHQYHAIPLYLLYNHFDSVTPRSYWHCCKCFDIEQLGCTLVPSWKIEDAIRPGRRGQRSFAAIHGTAPSRPWRCAFDCNSPEPQLMALARLPRQKLSPPLIGSDGEDTGFPGTYPEPLLIDLPHMFLEKAGPLRADALDQLRRLLPDDRRSPTRSSHEPLYPRKLLVVDCTGTVDDIGAEH